MSESTNTPEVLPPPAATEKGPVGLYERYEIVKTDELPFYEEAATRMGIRTSVIHREGGRYTEQPPVRNGVEQTLDHKPYSGTLLSGDNYVKISGQVPVDEGLGKFSFMVSDVKQEHKDKIPKPQHTW